MDFLFNALLEHNMKFFSEEGEIKHLLLSMFGPLSILSSKGVHKTNSIFKFLVHCGKISLHSK